MPVCSEQIISRLDGQNMFQMFTLFSGRNVGVLWKYTIEHDGSILDSVNLRKIFRRISEVWGNAQP